MVSKDIKKHVSNKNLIILAIFGQIIDLYFLTIFGKKSKKTAVKSDQKFFSKKSRQLKIFKNGALAVEISADPQIWGI